MTTTFESRVNGITQEEASHFQSAPEVFKVHRLPGHLQSESSPLTLTRCSAAHPPKLASRYIILPKQTSSQSESEAAILADGWDFKRLCAVSFALKINYKRRLAAAFSLFVDRLSQTWGPSVHNVCDEPSVFI